MQERWHVNPQALNSQFLNPCRSIHDLAAHAGVYWPCCKEVRLVHGPPSAEPDTPDLVALQEYFGRIMKKLKEVGASTDRTNFYV